MDCVPSNVIDIQLNLIVWVTYYYASGLVSLQGKSSLGFSMTMGLTMSYAELAPSVGCPIVGCTLVAPSHLPTDSER